MVLESVRQGDALYVPDCPGIDVTRPTDGDSADEFTFLIPLKSEVIIFIAYNKDAVVYDVFMVHIVCIVYMCVAEIKRGRKTRPNHLSRLLARCLYLTQAFMGQS